MSTRLLLSPSLRPAECAASYLCLTRLQNKILHDNTIRLLAAAYLLALPLIAPAQTSAYVQTNIISDGAVPATQTDPTLINPWGVSIGPQFWIDSPGSGFSLVEDGNGTKAFAVSVPPAKSTSVSWNSGGHGLQRRSNAVSNHWRPCAISLRHARWNDCRLEYLLFSGGDRRE